MSDDAPDPLDFRYPAIEPHADGFLDVDDGRRIWWEVSGSPSVRPVALLRGGRSAPSGPPLRRFFDPHAYRLVTLHQRG
jgi:proline iminopeptidase